MISWILPVALGLGQAWAGGQFLDALRKAESRSEPVEKIEYYSRAIRAWNATHGNALLANCHFRRGEAYFERREFQLAQSDLSKTIELDPRNARAYFLRGQISLKSSKFSPAERDFSECVGLEPEDSEGWFAAGLPGQSGKFPGPGCL